MMNFKLVKPFFIILLVLSFALVVSAKNYSDGLKVKDKLKDSDIINEQAKFDKKADRYVSDYNKAFNKNIDKTKIKFNNEVVENGISLTYVNIDGVDFTVISYVE